MQVVFFAGNYTETIPLHTIAKQKPIVDELHDWLKRNHLKNLNNNAGFYYIDNRH